MGKEVAGDREVTGPRQVGSAGIKLGFGAPDWPRLVPVDFESGESWWQGLRPPGSMPASRQ